MAANTRRPPNRRSRGARIAATVLGAVAFTSIAGAVGVVVAFGLDVSGPVGAVLVVGATIIGAGIGAITGRFLLGWRFRLPARLATVAVGIVAVAAPTVVALGAWIYSEARMTNVGELEFANELAVPPVLEPTTDAQGRKVFDLALETGRSELLNGTTTETWGANGSYLGPTLRAERGDEVVVNVTNDLPEPTTLHWHGMHLPAEMDGNPHQLIPPGDTWSPTWAIDQPAATLWYHPHPHGRTADHVYRGVAGLFLVDDPDASPEDLPDTYGVDDIPVVIQDKRFNGDASLDLAAPMFSSVGVLGDEILVNGTHDPSFEATTTLVRFRLHNASNARVYDIGFTDDREFSLVGTDSGLLPAPSAAQRVQLSPGERAEIVVTVEPGDETILRSYPPDLGTDRLSSRFAGGDDTFDLLQVTGADSLAESVELPDELVALDPIDERDAARTREFRLQGSRRINGQSMDMSRIDAEVTVDTIEIWEIENASGNPHNFHPHDVHFQVLDVDGRPPPAHLDGWKDTVYIPPRATVRIIMQFGDHTDPDIPYMFHCHILEHEDNGMMGQFIVVEP